MANLQLNKNFYILLSSSVGIIIRKQIHANTNFLQGFKAWFFFFHYYFTRQNTIVFIADPWVCHLSIGGLWMSMVAARTLLSAIFGLSDNKLISMLHWIHSTASTLGQRNILRRVSLAYKSKFGWTLSRQLGYFVFRLCQLWLCMGGLGIGWLIANWPSYCNLVQCLEDQWDIKRATCDPLQMRMSILRIKQANIPIISAKL